MNLLIRNIAQILSSGAASICRLVIGHILHLPLSIRLLVGCRNYACVLNFYLLLYIYIHWGIVMINILCAVHNVVLHNVMYKTDVLKISDRIFFSVATLDSMFDT